MFSQRSTSIMKTSHIFYKEVKTVLLQIVVSLIEINLNNIIDNDCLLHTRGPDIIRWKIKNNIYTVIKYLYKYYKIKK